ncbi:MAG: hydroxyacid dehydrogenase [Acidihalobacter sp.]|uniref:hydroxyacid dehydrogenase n=1 Tax=Acidihalobacter sp. TaxID=1872108 RepID=UPI00307D3AAD
MSDIVISEFMDEAAVSGLRSRFEVLYEPTLVNDPGRLSNALHGARALIVRNRTQVDADLLGSTGSLRVVGRLGVGLDNIDQEMCAARNIQVVPATGANNTAVAEYVVASMLLLVRGAFGANEAMLAGEWPRSRLIGGEVSGRTLGLVGFGGIAREVASRARAMGLEVHAFDPALAKDAPCWKALQVNCADSLEELLVGSDVVSLHVPLTPHTRHLIDGGKLALMRSNAILINTARGGVIDDAALADALRTGRIGGAAVDVFETEPLPADSVYRDTPNLLLTPHIAGVTCESNIRVSAMIARAVGRILETAA